MWSIGESLVRLIPEGCKFRNNAAGANLGRRRVTRKKKEKVMSKGPTHEQAQLHLQVYDLRREARLREARDWFQQNFRANSLDEAMKIAGPGTKSGPFFGMVVGYWEQACSLLNYGLLHEGLFFETSGEFFGVWESIKPFIGEFRDRFVDQNMFSNLEKAAKRYEEWSEKRAPGHLLAMRQFMTQQSSQAASSKA